MRAYSNAMRLGYKRIGFVPTMGYLHSGHISLLEKAKEKADVTVASIFVNPTQFAPNEDLSTYPRDAESDIKKLESADCDLLFMPEATEIYPKNYSTYVTVNKITELYEGAFRPTHFQGVATVVAKLFNIVLPDVAVFGQKDAQQVSVIKRMVADLNLDIQIVTSPTIREANGLAMSSRNVYLSQEEKEKATTIFQGLNLAKEVINKTNSIDAACKAFRSSIHTDFKIDYADIIDPDTFRFANNSSKNLLAIFAGKIGKTRLIDNMILR